MRAVADLHVHSRFSLATSSRMELGEIAWWARRKGLDLVGTGDCTHLGWLTEAGRMLRPVGDGIYEAGGVRFLFTGELSCVWREGGRGRRVHLVIVAPSRDGAVAVSRAVARFGNVASNGRPVLGTSVQRAVDAIMTASPDTTIIPAHIWTPWYSVLGKRSGFDSLEECFGPYIEHVTAVETGLSSDPSMCRRVSTLDPRTLVSFSDAHGPERLGREATVFELDEMSYPALRAALVAGPADRGSRVTSTVEMFPQEGKYYHDGHRSCGVSVTPAEAGRLGGLCPACGGGLTLGVLHRVEELADRARPIRVPTHEHVIPLDEIVARLLLRGPRTLAVAAAVEELVGRYGSELSVLVDRPVEDLQGAKPLGLKNAVASIRAGRVTASPGYDGVYGVVRAVAESS